MSESEAPSATPPEQTTSRADDYVDIFLSPADVFRRRQPKDWVQPFVILVVASLVVYIASLPAQSIIMQSLAAQQGQSAEAVAAAQRFAGIGRIIGAIAIPIVLIVACAYTGALLWLGSRMVDAAVSFKQAFLIAVFARFITIPEGLFKAGSLMLSARGGSAVHPMQDQSFGLLRFMNTTGLPAAVVPLLNQIDVFTIWQAAIWGIAIAMVAEAPRGRAITVAVIAWILAAAPQVIMAAIRPQSMMLG